MGFPVDTLAAALEKSANRKGKAVGRFAPVKVMRLAFGLSPKIVALGAAEELQGCPQQSVTSDFCNSPILSCMSVFAAHGSVLVLSPCLYLEMATSMTAY